MVSGNSLRRYSPVPLVLFGMTVWCVSCSTRHTTRPAVSTPTKPHSLRVENVRETRPKQGDLLARLFVNDQRVDVTMWMDTSDVPEDSWYCDSIQVEAYPLPQNRVLVMEQPDVLCAARACKIWDIEGAMWLDADCPDFAGARLSMTHLRGDLFFVASMMEGPADMRLIRLNEQGKPTTVLEHITSDARLAQDGRGVVIESACHPGTGQVAGSYPKDVECGPMFEGCGYCPRMYAQPVSWYWAPGVPVRRLTENATSR